MNKLADIKPFKIIFFGDSICFGQYLSPHRGWVTRLSQHLADLGSEYGRDIIVANSSINGRTTRQALESMPFEVQSHKPDFLVLQYGMNDCNYWVTDGGVPRVSKQGFAANLTEMISRAKATGVSSVLLNTNHPTTLHNKVMPIVGFSYQQSNSEYNEIIREVARVHADYVTLHDIETEFLELVREGYALEDLVLEDGLHLSEAGHDIYFSKTKVMLTKLLSKMFADELDK